MVSLEKQSKSLQQQQDGATPHFVREPIQFLKEKFTGRSISRNGGVNCLIDELEVSNFSKREVVWRIGRSKLSDILIHI